MLGKVQYSGRIVDSFRPTWVVSHGATTCTKHPCSTAPLLARRTFLGTRGVKLCYKSTRPARSPGLSDGGIIKLRPSPDDGLHLQMRGIQVFSPVEDQDSEAIIFYSPELLPVLDGDTRPSGHASTADAVAVWEKANGRLYYLLFFATSGSAQLTVRAHDCLLYTSPSPRDKRQSRMPSSA